MPKTNWHCRIGRVRLKNGADVRLLPSLRDRNTSNMFDNLSRANRHVRNLYGNDLGWFVMIAWQHDGSFNTFIASTTDYPTRNTLPEWAAEAIRRGNNEYDCDRLITHRFGI